MAHITLKICGMTCQACANRLEKVLNKQPFVQQAVVNFAIEEAQICFDTKQVEPDKILKVVQQTGFSAEIKNELNEKRQNSVKMTLRLGILLGITFLFCLEMCAMLVGLHHFILPLWLQCILATVVQFGLALPFYFRAWASIKGKMANMDVLISAGSLVIYGYSLYSFFHQLPVYFEAGVMVIGFVSLGKYLEDKIKREKLNSLNSLFNLVPKTAWVLRDDEWRNLPLAEITVGDTLKIMHGERFVGDGIVVQGNGWAEQSHLTGESEATLLEIGSRVLAGSILVNGHLIYRIEQLGKQTQLGDMMAALAEAQGSKAPIARFAERVVAIFVPCVFAVAFLTFVASYLLVDFSHAILHAVAVLVVACPCALGLATPAAVMVGMGNAARCGIWFKNAAEMEAAANVDVVVLDKTGTLTSGKPRVEAVWLSEASSYSLADMLRLAAAVEQHANHPLGVAIVQEAFAKNLEIPTACHLDVSVGEGIEGEVLGVGLVRVGGLSYCAMDLPVSCALDPLWQTASLVAVAVNQQPLGIFAIADSLKADSLNAIHRLKKEQIEIWVMSGDRLSAVEYVAQQLGIKNALSNLSPRQKAEQIQTLKRDGKRVAMVGDGVNDAPALAVADVSFAMRNGAEVAEHIASATLMQSSVNQVAEALCIAKATLKNIKQNLFLALIYNVLMIPLAAFGYLTPALASGAMAMSSVSVLLNAMRLKKS